MEERTVIDEMASFVRGGVAAGKTGAVEGADWTPSEPPNGTPAPVQAALSSTPPAASEYNAEMIGVDLKTGLLVTSIGNFALHPKERNRIGKACLRTLKAELQAIYKRSRLATPTGDSPQRTVRKRVVRKRRPRKPRVGTSS